MKASTEGLRWVRGFWFAFGGIGLWTGLVAGWLSCGWDLPFAANEILSVCFCGQVSGDGLLTCV